MALFENMFGTRPAGRGYTPPKPKPARFRPMNRFEKNIPEMRDLYYRQKKEWEKKKKEEDELSAEIDKEMEAKYGKDFKRKFIEETIAKQRAESKESATKAAADMRSGKTSSFKGAAAGGIPTFKPATLDTKKAEGPVQVRRAIPQERVFKAMVSGKPEASQVFSSQAQADKYLQEEYNKRVSGLQTDWRKATDRGDTATAKKLENQIKSQRMGVVASVRGTPEEMTRYKEESKAGEREKERLSKLYKQRQEEAQGRVAKAREAMQAYDEATTPAQKESARAGIEAARLESAMAQSTRGMSEEQRKKFAEGLGGVLERRKQREAETEAKTRVARAESREQEKSRVMQKDVTKQISDYKKSLSALKRAHNQARQAGDEFGAFQLLEYIKYFTSNVPEDEKKLREYAMSGRLAEDQKYLRSIAGDREE